MNYVLIVVSLAPLVVVFRHYFFADATLVPVEPNRTHFWKKKKIHHSDEMRLCAFDLVVIQKS